MSIAETISRLVIWFALCSAVFLPVRFALMMLLVAFQFDASPPDYSSATSLGLENAIKTVLLPTILMWRIRPDWKRLSSLGFSRPWMLFLCYAALAIIWSPFRLSGIKLIGYLYSFTVVVALVASGVMAGWFTDKVKLRLLSLALFLCVFQTYVLGNPRGFIPEEGVFRVTGFCDPQNFAAYVLYLSTLVFASTRLTKLSVLLLSASFITILASGSRYVTIGAVLSFAITSAIKSRDGEKKSALRLVARIAISGLLFIVTIAAFLSFSPESRLTQLGSFVDKSASYEDIGTLGWRLLIYGEAYNQLTERSAPASIFGFGTSSGAEVVLAFDPKYDRSTIDANRIVHNEFLRSLYEWGLIGFPLLIVCLYMVMKAAVGGVIAGDKSFIALVAILPAILAALSMENVFANASSPAGAGMAIVLAFAFSGQQTTDRGDLRPSDLVRHHGG